MKIPAAVLPIKLLLTLLAPTFTDICTSTCGIRNHDNYQIYFWPDFCPPMTALWPWEPTTDGHSTFARIDHCRCRCAARGCSSSPTCTSLFRHQFAMGIWTPRWAKLGLLCDVWPSYANSATRRTVWRDIDSWSHILKPLHLDWEVPAPKPGTERRTDGIFFAQTAAVTLRSTWSGMKHMSTKLTNILVINVTFGEPIERANYGKTMAGCRIRDSGPYASLICRNSTF